MYLDKPIFIDDINSLRKEVLELECANSKKAQLWRVIRNGARESPTSFPWHTPLVALLTQEKKDIDNAKSVIDSYLEKLEPLSFHSGLQLHFWCFAFPHAKWALYFQWLCTMGAYTVEEQKEKSEVFIKYQFINFYYGLKTKPEPECVDNQVLSLALSCALVGFLFSTGDNSSTMARIMRRDGLRRLPITIGSMPLSGYTGEGSTYMDCVNGAVIPIAIELLELVTGEKELLSKAFEPNSCKPITVLEVVAREWMPGGLLLPWDSYGYQHGTRAAIAYGAKNTGKDEYFDILENKTVWSYDVGIGWAYDDLPWTLVWWPENRKSEKKERNWFDETIGGIVQTPDNQRYFMQMWDESAPRTPSRMHVNPNAVLFNAFETPLSADGTKEDDCKRFQFEDTYHATDALVVGETTRYNYGDGCGGGHSILLVDNWEGMRAFSKYQQYKEATADLEKNWVYADVAPIYQEKWPDIQKVARKTSLHSDHFFLVEDLFVADKPHEITSRFLLRPNYVPVQKGIKIETPEGITLHILDVLGQEEISKEEVLGFPRLPDGKSTLSDFKKGGSLLRNLFVAFVSRTREQMPYESGFACIADMSNNLTFPAAVERLEKSECRVPLRLPAYMEENIALAPRYWYQKRLLKKQGEAYLIIPRGIRIPRLWIEGTEISLREYETSQFLLAPHVRIPEEFQHNEEIDVVFTSEVVTSHYQGNANGMTVSINGGIAFAYPVQEEIVHQVEYQNNRLKIETNFETYHVDYKQMEV